MDRELTPPTSHHSLYAKVEIPQGVEIAESKQDVVNAVLHGLGVVDAWVSNVVPLMESIGEELKQPAPSLERAQRLDTDVAKIIDYLDFITYSRTLLEFHGKQIKDADERDIFDLLATAVKIIPKYTNNLFLEDDLSISVRTPEGSFLPFSDEDMEQLMQTYCERVQEMGQAFATGFQQEEEGGVELRGQRDIRVLFMKLPLIAHDLRSPLSMVHSYVDLANIVGVENMPESHFSDFPESVDRGLQRMRILLEQRLEPVQITLNDFVGLLDEAIGYQSGDQGNGLRTHVPEDELGNELIEIDLEILKSLGDNIRTNCIKAYNRRDAEHPDRSGLSRDIITTVSPGSTYLTFGIEDRAVGFPQPIIDRGRFMYRATEWGETGSGTGIGMATLTDLLKVFDIRLTPKNVMRTIEVDGEMRQVTCARYELLLPRTTR